MTSSALMELIAHTVVVLCSREEAPQMWLVHDKRGRKSIGPSFARLLKEMHINERILLRLLVYWF